MDVPGSPGPRSSPRATPLNERTPESPRRFRIHRCLGRGGFGEVYRATMSRDGGVTSEVAVKILAADLDPTSDAVTRLRDEGRLLGALSHPAILNVYDLVLLAGRVALVTEYVEGQDLHRVMFGPGAMPFRALVESIGQVAEALHAAWTTESPYGGGPMHLVHRDVKPQNVRVGVHGQVKLLDFGIARAANVQREANTQTNLLLGSWPYLAPERLREEEKSPTPAIDVYSLGCTLYEGLTGERLMEGRKLLELYRVVEEPGGFERLVAERLPKAQRKAPPPVYQLLTALLKEDPAERPEPNALAHRCEDLAEALPGLGIRRWARERDWPPAEEEDGPLTDYDLTEGSLEVPSTRGGPLLGATPVPTVRTLDPGRQAPGSAVPPPPPPPFGTPVTAGRRVAAPAPVRNAPVDRRVAGANARTTPMPAAARDARGIEDSAPPTDEDPTPLAAAPRGTPTAAPRPTPAGGPRPTPAPAPRQSPAAAQPRGAAPAPARSVPAAPAPAAPRARPASSAAEQQTVVLPVGETSHEPAVDLLAIRIDEDVQRGSQESPPSAVRVGLGVALAALLAMAVVAVSVVGVGVWWFTRPPTVAATPPVDVPVAGPLPAPEVPVDPVPTAPPEPAAPAPEPAAPVPAAPAPPAPAPVGPAPGPKPPPKPKPAEPSTAFPTLKVSGDATIELRGDFGAFRAGTPSLPPGVYELWADFGEGFGDTGKRTEAKLGGTVVVRCDRTKKACTLSP